MRNCQACCPAEGLSDFLLFIGCKQHKLNDHPVVFASRPDSGDKAAPFVISRAEQDAANLVGDCITEDI
ncbi:MAG: hypothetical protein QOJ99_38 [Bryobacterales bacterium]|nr:hypothetical protein [Bryobacterales bacterium]